MLDPHLLEILVCPKCKGSLKYVVEEPALVCGKCQLSYEIKDDIPVMIIDDAKPIQGQGRM